jgi:glycosyl hydrolase family 57
LWPSEGSVSDEVFTLAADAGFQWTATDNGVLDRTLGRHTGIDGIYRPYEWRQGDRRLRVIFRDHFLSDLIGFTYSRMNPQDAASDFLNRIRENCRYVRSGRDALAPIILDGENAWEYYEHNGRPFLRELYRQISEDPQMSAVTVAEALRKIGPDPLDHIFPGSWINANFDVWLGAEEDNRAWEYLLRARQTFDSTTDASEEQKRMAYEELLIAEGSDWNWWYGPEHESVNREEFDQLYRGHLANVYRALGRPAPEELGRPILRLTVREFHLDPTGAISPVIDGEVTSYFEWIGAGVYRVDPRSGAMHGKRLLTREAHYGNDRENFFLRLDFYSLTEELAGQIEVQVNLRPAGASQYKPLVIALRDAGAPSHDSVIWAFKSVLEVRVPFEWLGAKPGEPIQFQISIWQAGLPIDALPQQGWLEAPGGEVGEWER